MSRFSKKLTWLLRARVAGRLIVPIGVLWGIYDWFWIHPLCAIIYGLLTFNYVLALIFVVAKSPQVNGPLRIRPFQTFILLINAFVLPIVYYRTHGEVIWFFILVCLLMVAGLYAGVVTYIYFMQKLPMAPLFQKQHANKEAPTEPIPAP